MAKVEITTGLVGGTVVVDGADVSDAICGFRLDSRRGRSVLTLDVLLHEAVTRGEADVQVPRQSHDALIALGWTPPGPLNRESMAAMDVSNAEHHHLSAHAHGGETP